MRQPRARATAKDKDVSGQRDAAAEGAVSDIWAHSGKPIPDRVTILEQTVSLLISHDIRTQDRLRVLEKIVAQLLGAQ